MQKEDIKSFFAEEGELDWDRFVIETYWFETTTDPDLAAASLCSEKSTAQWKRPHIEEDLRPCYGAKVIGLEVLEVSDTPVIKSAFNNGRRFSRCRVRIAHPHINFGPKIPNLLTAACGEGAFHAPDVTAIKLLDLSFPASYLKGFPGPQFGVKGMREIMRINDRPIFIGVVKPNIGLKPVDFAKISYEGWLGGLDIAKDDEMLSDCTYSPLRERARAVNFQRMEAEQKTGEKKVYLANITDEVERLIELHDIAVENGAGAVMINGMTTGLSAIRMLRKKASVPIVGHFDFIAPFSRIPFFGVSSCVITKLQRLAGCDAIIMPGFGARMMTDEEEVKANADVCLKTLGDQKRVMPVPGGSDWAGTLPLVYEKLRTIDFGFIMGRGVFGHPLGAKAGAMSIRQAWEAIVNRAPLSEYAKTYNELKTALEAFSSKEISDESATQIISEDMTEREIYETSNS